MTQWHLGTPVNAGKLTWIFKAYTFLFVTGTFWSTLTDGFTSSSNEAFLCLSATFTSWSHPACLMPQVIAQTDLLPAGAASVRSCPSSASLRCCHTQEDIQHSEKRNYSREQLLLTETQLSSPHICVLYQTWQVIQNNDPEVLHFPSGFPNIVKAIWSRLLI